MSWILPSRIEAFVLIGALARLGAVQNPILPIYRHREVGFITRQTGCRLLVVPGTFRNVDYEKMAREATEDLDVEILVADPDLPEGDPATLGPPASGAGNPLRWLFYTSGTVADPKGARHSDASIAAANLGMQWSLRCDPTDRVAVVFPITHVGGVVWMFNTMETGAELLLVEVFSPEDTPVFLARNEVTVAPAGTVFWQAYLAAQRKQPDRPLFPEVRVFAGRWRTQAATHPLRADGGDGRAGDRRMGPHRVADQHDDGARLSRREEGHHRGQGVPGGGAARRHRRRHGRQARRRGRAAGARDAGVHRLPRLEPRCRWFTDDSDGGERWFRTGDLGFIDDDGYVTLTGRLKDIIIRKGENISAKEIEDLLFAHPKVVDVAVVGRAGSCER